MSQIAENRQRMFIQWCMSAQVFSETKLFQALQRIYNTSEMVSQDIIDAANNLLSTYSLELRNTMDQSSGERYWAISNTTADTISNSATPYSASELAILKALIEEIYTEKAGNYALSLHAALKSAATNGPTGFTRGAAGDLIDRFCQDGWLGRDEGYVVLGARALIELHSFLSEGYGDYQRVCALCSEIATKGLVCTACAAVVHPFCAEQISSSIGSDNHHMLSCPSCRKQIENPDRFGPGESGVPHVFDTTQPESEAELEPESDSPKGRKRLAVDSDDDEE